MRYTINDDEIGFITLYFVAALEEPQNKPKAIILCETRLPIGNLLAAKLRPVFNIDVVDIACLSQKEKILSKHEVDLIITTFPFIHKNIPCITVDHLLTQENITSIRNLLKVYKKGRKSLLDKSC